jgi:hypothetical protein
MAGTHVQPMTPAEIAEAERLASAWFQPVFTLCVSMALACSPWPTLTKPGVLAYPAGADETKVCALVIARCSGLGPAAFDPKLLGGRIAKARFVAITALADHEKRSIIEIAVAHALDMDVLLIESPRRFEDQWVQLVIDLNGRAQITLDRPQLAVSAW